MNGNEIITQHDCCNDLTFYYGIDGLTGFHIKSTNAIYNKENLDHDFYYKKNLQGDIIGIIDSNGEEIVKYVYDAWGNHKAYNAKTDEPLDISRFESYTDTSNIVQFIAIKNPFRYRSYYYDIETGLYYLNSRYYDPEVCRFINADDISILSEGKEFINGLNLYAYCNSNPIMHSDQNGAAWWDWLIAIFIVVAVVVATVAITIATGGVGTTMIAGALIGAGISGITSTITQLATTGTLNPFQLFADMAFGAITGLIGGSALGFVGAGLTMGATGFASSMVTDLISTGSVNYGKAALMAVVTGLLGAHAGAQNGLTSKTSSLMNSINTVNNKIKQGLYSLSGANGARNLLNYHISKAQGILTFQSMNKLFISIIATNYAHESIFNELVNGLFK